MQAPNYLLECGSLGSTGCISFSDVVDSGNAWLNKLNSSGSVIKTFKWGWGSGVNGQFWYSPWAVAVDASGNMWVDDMAEGRYEKFNPSLARTLARSVVLRAAADTHLAAIVHLETQERLAFDSSGNVWVTG